MLSDSEGATQRLPEGAEAPSGHPPRTPFGRTLLTFMKSSSSKRVPRAAGAERRGAGPRSRHVVRFTTAEAEDVAGQASAAHITISELLRRRALGQRVAVGLVVPAVNDEVARQLAGACNNLNQLTRLAHEGRAPAATDVLATITELLEIARAVGLRVRGAARE